MKAVAMRDPLHCLLGSFAVSSSSCGHISAFNIRLNWGLGSAQVVSGGSPSPLLCFVCRMTSVLRLIYFPTVNSSELPEEPSVCHVINLAGRIASLGVLKISSSSLLLPVLQSFCQALPRVGF
jgi:hypothetical protein